MAKVFSGIQPSGQLTIGHYTGSIRNWLSLQQEHECFFCIVDLHAITVAQKPENLRQNIKSALALYLACGLDYKKQTIFIQSHVPEHTQMAWLLECITPLGQLQRMTQFKDKSQIQSKAVNAGLLTYPILMASDILLYKANFVPVGEDQKQHLELARDLVDKFNKLYGDILVAPEPFIASQGGRLMSLQDPSKKMSKSDPNVNSWISLLDAPEIVLKKLKKAVTDSDANVAYDLSRPGISNLVSIYSLFAGIGLDEVENRYVGQGYGVFKNDLAELITSVLNPIQAQYQLFIDDAQLLQQVASNGAEKASITANKVYNEVKSVIGL